MWNEIRKSLAEAKKAPYEKKAAAQKEEYEKFVKTEEAKCNPMGSFIQQIHHPFPPIGKKADVISVY